MTTETCKNCWWWSRPDAEATLGQCRCHAPSTVETDCNAAFSGRAQQTLWPVTEAIDWCGDFRHNVSCDAPSLQAWKDAQIDQTYQFLSDFVKTRIELAP